MADAPFRILLYYLYVPLEDPAGYLEEHRTLCERLGLKGRILIAGEGINGTVSGPVEATEEYMRVLRDDPRTSAMEFKLDEADGHVFPRLSIKLRSEVVTLGLDELEGRKIMTYCTGGIRCEKFSGFLRQEGFEEVYQLHGGIVTYGKDPEVRGEKFEGKCYVFDERIGVEINRTGGAKVVARCRHCGVVRDRYVNCAWKPCNEQHFACEACEERTGRYCGRACAEAALVSLAAECNE